MKAEMNNRGFTLIEVVVAMFILAVLSVLSWQSVDLILKANARSEEDLAEEMKLYRTWQILGNDLIHIRPRTYADGLGGLELAYETGIDDFDYVLRFTRGGDATTAENPSGLTRVQYVLEESGLYRLSLPAHLSPREAEPLRQLLLSDVSYLEFEHLDNENFFVPEWPPLNEQRGNASLPSMIRVTLELGDGTITTQTFPGVGGS